MNSIWKLVALSFLVANNFGGAMASANTKIMNLYKQKSYYAFEFTSTVNSIVTVSIIVGFMLGAMFASTLAKKFSKRKIGAIASAFACLFNLLSMIPVHWIYLSVMRVLLGASITTITTIIPGWLFDLSPAAKRSLLSSTYQFFLTFGIFISSTVMLGIKSDVDKFWQAFLYDAVVNVACSFVCLSIKEETAPVHGLQTQVQTVQETNQTVQEQNNTVLENKNEITWGSKQLRRAKLTIVLFSVGSQISGINVVIMYATQIFQNYFDSPMSDVYGSLIAAGVNAVSTLPALPFVSKFNRKTILFFGWFLMNLGHLMLIAAYVFDVQLLILIGSIVFLLGFEFGPGTMMVVVLGEIHPRKFNQQLNSFGYTIMWIVNIIVVITFPYFEKIVWAAYTIYFAVSFICGVILCKIMPETRGKSSDEIDSEVLGIKTVQDEIIKDDLKIANDETPVGRLNTAEQTVENEDK
ncbi:Hexose_transporter [Hexamita inflata]|uniref:Hexose transporter n=1 Tax=Hexamita inflata TaxID=28002 RepID=A0AA86Q0H0_9EUKA|nr:Hexose transporter [Hexamita inflata]